MAALRPVYGGAITGASNPRRRALMLLPESFYAQRRMIQLQGKDLQGEEYAQDT
jgi:hypothetical protein